jgi:dTDP-4-amino-4,6-dideoxygalactose transaminase
MSCSRRTDPSADAAPRAIGSVLPFPDVAALPPRPDSLWAEWTRPWGAVACYTCARAALAALLRHRGVARCWLPAYACVALADGARGATLCWYGVDAALRPDVTALARGLRAGDAVVITAFFGRDPGADVARLAASRPDVLWIEDRAHAIDPGRSAWARAAIRSPRKLIGVADGGLLLADQALPTPGGPATQRPPIAQMARCHDPDGHHPERWFPAFQAQEAALGVDDSPMSPATREVLERVALPPLAAARRANAAVLRAALPDLVLWPEAADFSPLVVAIRLADRDAVAASLAASGIFCPRHWAVLPGEAAGFAQAQRLARTLLSLPCDHRYDASDMARIAAALRGCGARRASG